MISVNLLTETYVRKVDKLVHLTVNGEEIITTVDYPFYVNGQGFVHAVDLCIGLELVDSAGNIPISQKYRAEMMIKEAELERVLQGMIDGLLKKE